MVPYDTREKWERKLWEDEEISYGCENTTLVLNSVKGLKSMSYTCQESGEYSTPDGTKANMWPICTINPIDPRKTIGLLCSCNETLTNRERLLPFQK